MKYVVPIFFIAALSVGIFAGQNSWDGKKESRYIIKDRNPAEEGRSLARVESVDETTNGVQAFLDDLYLDTDSDYFLVKSKSFILPGSVKEVCDNASEVEYYLEAEGIASLGSHTEDSAIKIKVASQNCNAEEGRLFPIEFCEGEVLSDSIDDSTGDEYSFFNFDGYFPRSWILRKVNFKTDDGRSLEVDLSSKISELGSDPYTISCKDYQ